MMKNIISLAAITIASTMLSYGTLRAEMAKGESTQGDMAQVGMTDDMLGLEASAPTSSWVCWIPGGLICFCRNAKGEIKEKSVGGSIPTCKMIQDTLNELERK